MPQSEHIAIPHPQQSVNVCFPIDWRQGREASDSVAVRLLN